MPRGGSRVGSGRRPGAKNKTTLTREKAEKAAMQAVKRQFSEAEIESMDMLAIMEHAARAALASGDYKAAAQLASLSAPYTHAKKLPEAPAFVMPSELVPIPRRDGESEDEWRARTIREDGAMYDPPSCPDEPGPANPVP